jgi:hypothetical protein
MNDDNEKIIKEQFPLKIHSLSIKLPAIVEMQLKNNRLLRDAINNYRRYERYSNPSKITKPSSIKTIDEEDILMINTEPVCPIKSKDNPDSSLENLSTAKLNLSSLMKQIYNQCQNKTNNVCLFLSNRSFFSLFFNRKKIN